MVNIFGQSPVKKIFFKEILFETLKAFQKPQNLIVNLSFVSGKEIRELNKKYRLEDKITDVLSFPSAFENPLFLGDVIICLSQAKKQAKTLKHPLETELGLLFVHGLLHLFGLNHKNKLQKKEFQFKQKGILLKIN